MIYLKQYPRQFVVSNLEAKTLPEFKKLKLGKFYIYHCPTLIINYLVDDKNKNFGIVFGFVIMEDNCKIDEKSFLQEILKKSDINEITRFISKLSGRFVIFIYFNGSGFVFNDPVGLRTVYFVNKTDSVIFGTQPLILGEFCSLVSGTKSELFFHSEYYRTADEYWLPTGQSVYENVEQLIPNHYLNIDILKQFRFWPFEVLPKFDFENNLNQLESELTDSIEHANLKFELALPLTSGLDSRLLLALSRKISSKLIYYTRIHKSNINKTHQDIVIPGKILKKLGMIHHIINAEAKISNQTEERYKLNNSTSRFRDSSTLFSADASILKSKCVLYGNLSEIIKIRNPNKEYLSLQDFEVLPKKWLEISFIKSYLEDWLNEAKEIEHRYQINVYELFYWEHRMGNWAARAYNENDLLFEVFTPFNSRSILSKVLSIDIKDRGLPEAKFHRKLIQELWPEIDKFPYNSRSLNELFKAGIKKLLRTVGLASLIFKINNFIIK
jgi:hypothetical protein